MIPHPAALARPLRSRTLRHVRELWPGRDRIRWLCSNFIHYEGTLKISSVVEGDRSFAEWSANYECPHQDAQYWANWWAQSLPAWLSSLRNHLDRRHGVLDLDNLPEG